MDPHNANEQSCLAETIITPANQWISSKINVLVIEDREFQFLEAKTNQSTALLAVEEGFSRDQTSNPFSREGYWLKGELKHGGEPGYVDGQFAQPVETTQAAPKVTTAPVAGAYKTIKDVDLRQEPGPNIPWSLRSLLESEST